MPNVQGVRLLCTVSRVGVGGGPWGSLLLWRWESSHGGASLFYPKP